MTVFLDAVQNLCGEGSFYLEGNDAYDNILRWNNVDPIPTFAEVETEVQRLTVELNWSSLRQQRNNLIAETDYLALSDATMTDDIKTYRQALRDLPANTTDPANPVWPTKPGGSS